MLRNIILTSPWYYKEQRIPYLDITFVHWFILKDIKIYCNDKSIAWIHQPGKTHMYTLVAVPHPNRSSITLWHYCPFPFPYYCIIVYRIYIWTDLYALSKNNDALSVYTMCASRPSTAWIDNTGGNLPRAFTISLIPRRRSPLISTTFDPLVTNQQRTQRLK